MSDGERIAMAIGMLEKLRRTSLLMAVSAPEPNLARAFEVEAETLWNVMKVLGGETQEN